MDAHTPLRIGVVRGGRSPEREFSLRSGYHVAAALRHLNHDPVELDVDEGLTSELQTCDAVFLALHGKDGEDGTIQAVLEVLGVPYTGSDPIACQLCFDKAVAKSMLGRANIRTPPSFVVSETAVRQMGAGIAVREAAARLGFPLVVKPAAQGSALGLAVVRAQSELTPAVLSAFNYGDRVLLEQFVEGREISVTLVGPDLRALPAVEIRTKGDVFDFHARVTPGEVDYICPAPLDQTMLDLTSKVALDSAQALGVRDFARVDLVLAPDDQVWLLDLKTCPGLTETSLVTRAVGAADLAFEDFVASVLKATLSRSDLRQLKG